MMLSAISSQLSANAESWLLEGWKVTCFVIRMDK
jgi:hypothetical protein